MSIDFRPRNSNCESFNLNVNQYTIIGEVMKYIGVPGDTSTKITYPPFHASQIDCDLFVGRLSKIRFNDRKIIMKNISPLIDHNQLDAHISEWIDFLSTCGGYDVEE